MKKLSYLMLLSLVLTLTSVSLSSAVESIQLYDGTRRKQVADSSFANLYVKINNNGWLVWPDCPEATLMDPYCFDGDTEIFLYDGTRTSQLTNNGRDDWYVDMNDNGEVVWSGGGIWLYDGSTSSRIADSGDNPRINNNGYVVWSEGGGSDGEIFLYDGASTTQLTNNDYRDERPQINDNGYVVWHGAGLWLYDGSTSSKIADSGAWARINNNGHVVWLDLGPDSGVGVFLYDGTSITQLTNNVAYLFTSPQINDNGYVVWMEDLDSEEGTDTEIFLYDGTSTIQLANNASGIYFPQINDDGWVVWVGSYSNGGIFLYKDSLPPTRLTYYDYDRNPQINDNGWVVWIRRSNCFIATAAFGTDLDGKIDVLRTFRDRYLVSNSTGQSFLATYEKYSPPLADYIVERPWAQSLVRFLLLPVIGIVSLFV